MTEYRICERLLLTPDCDTAAMRDASVGAAALIEELAAALTDARNNILTLLGGFRDDMPDVAVKLFQAQARQIDAALAKLSGE